MTHSKTAAAALSLLLATSVLVPFVAVGAFAQTADHSKTFEETGDIRFVGFDTDGWSADTFTVRISTSDGPGGTDVVLYEQEHTTADLQQSGSVQVFENANAYNQITIEILGTSNSEPEWGTGASFSNDVWRTTDAFGSTGGDRDLVADADEKFAMAVNPGLNIVDVSRDFTSVNETEVQGLDANDTKLELYQSAASNGDTADNFHAVSNNFLQDAETVALIKGKNAAIRSMNAYGSQSTAEVAGKENVSEFYSSQERNFLAQWNSQMAEAEYLQGLAKNETGVDPLYVHGSWTLHDSSGWEVVNSTILGFGSSNYTLRNGTKVDATTVDVEVVIRDTANDNYYTYSATFGPVTGDKTAAATVGFGASTSDNGATTVEGIAINPPDSNYDELEFVDFSEYSGDFSSVKSQNSNAQDKVVTVVNQTYDQYKAGQINSSDLVNPYDLHSEANPGDDFQGWAAATLAMAGTNQPTDFETTGQMNVTLEDGTQHQGIIHSYENPPSGQFEVNQTYNPDNFGGPIYVATSDDIKEINQNFTLDDLKTLDGESVQNFTVVEKNYTTESAGDLQKLNDQMLELRAELEAREQKRSGGGALLGGSGSNTVIILVAVAALLAMMMRDDSNNGGGRPRRRY